MALVEEPKRPGVFTFTWSIRNFSRCLSKENEHINSPNFYFGNIKWNLQLYPKGDECPNFISLYLLVHDDSPEDNTFMYVLSFQKCNGLYNDSIELENGHWPFMCRNFLSLDELHKPDVYLNHDVLTLRCQVWKKVADLSKSINCFALTKIKIAKLNYLWVLEDLVDSNGVLSHKFKQSTGILNFSAAFANIKLHLSTGETFDDDTIYFAIDIQDNDSTPLLTVYQIHLLNSNGSVVHSISGDVLFQDKGDILQFPFLSKRKLLTNKESYLLSGKLTVKCELSFSGNLEVERVEYGLTEEQNSKPVAPNHNTLLDGHILWKENMRQFYSDGAFSDLILRTPKREIPIHRAILCAQSEVFRRMLTHDMKEKNSGVFEINDFEDDTVSKLLLYLYTNTLDQDLDYALAKDLYFAADKYQISPLQKICSKHLMDNMDASNVCDILLLADQLQDQELMSTARDLIVSSPYEIMNSGGWKNLMETNSQLTSETMQGMIFNNFLSYKK